MDDNDGRKVHAKLPALEKDGVVQVIHDDTGEILYTIRKKAGFEPPVYAPGKYTVKFGNDTPEKVILSSSEVE